jgi:acetylornithine/succinyldiaminopimelate/putrescine aminotransferase
MIREEIPNFLRLYLNPYVAQTCFCLGRYVEDTWHTKSFSNAEFQSFLANSFDEALSGAIKLARYTSNLQRRSPHGLILDPAGRLGPFASLKLRDESTLEFVPRLTIVQSKVELQLLGPSQERFGFLVLLPSADHSWPPGLDALQPLLWEPLPLIIACLDRDALFVCREKASSSLLRWLPDIVVFDESFVNHEVPFGAFTARKTLYDCWNSIGKGAFHSTTYQPNTISTLHFLNCMKQADPDFQAGITDELARICQDPHVCFARLGELYSPSLARTIAAAGFDTSDVRAAGHYVELKDRTIFDGVAGVACSIRGHNPSSYVDEIGQANARDARALVAERLAELTGLENLVPAVSGASAVENALRIALAVQYPRRFVLAFQGGFGGKTLLALTGTARSFYRAHLDPLYENVCYVDPFAVDVLDQIERVLQQHPVGVVQLELIQAVGGVRALPLPVLRYLEQHKSRRDYLLFVDEVQTGMYRTGPFILSKKLGLTPDILTLGKGTSDMMFPFALTLYSREIDKRLAGVQPELTRAIHQRYGYEVGYQSVLNTLERSEDTGQAARVAEVGDMFSRLLQEQLAPCKQVRQIRVHGLLIGIELETAGWPNRWFKKQIASLYALRMLQNRSFPLLIGYCQYEPHVLKLTPPLSVTNQEVHQICETIATTLHQPWYKLLPAALGAWTRSSRRGSWKRKLTRA